MRVLATSSRIPFAVDEIRMLGERGGAVIAADTFRTSPGTHTRSVGDRVIVSAIGSH